MALKKIAILMEVDIDEKEISCGTLRADKAPVPAIMRVQVPGADETYLVFIHDSDESKPIGEGNVQAMVDCAAHEIGHVLSSVFKLPGGMLDDPRGNGELNTPELYNNPTLQQRQRIWNNEIMAWNIARKVRPQLDEAGVKRALDSYRERIPPPDMDSEA